MFPNITHFSQNWVDGMKVSAESFLAQDHSVQDSLRDTRCLSISPLKFGILPGGAPVFEVINSSSEIKLILKKCRAVTSDGFRIEITEAFHHLEVDLGQKLTTSLASQNGNYGIYLKINPYEGVEAGEEASEGPPRRIHRVPQYELALREGMHSLEYNWLLVGRLIVASGQGQVDTAFLPPCFMVDTLQEFGHNFYEKILGEVEAILKDAPGAVFKAKAYSKTNKDLPEEAAFFAEQILNLVAQQIGYYRFVARYNSPILLVANLVSLAEVCLQTLKCLSSADTLLRTRYPHLVPEFGDLEEIGLQMQKLRIDTLTNIYPALDTGVRLVRTLAKLLQEIKEDPFQVVGPIVGN